jgi:hypothetical protein
MVLLNPLLYCTNMLLRTYANELTALMSKQKRKKWNRLFVSLRVLTRAPRTEILQRICQEDADSSR